MKRTIATALLGAGLTAAAWAGAWSAPMADLAGAVVVTAGAAADPVERQAAYMLRDELRKRTGVLLAEATSLPAENVPAIIVGSRERMPGLPPGAALPAPVMKDGRPAPEGFAVAVDTAARPAATVYAIGNDRRGALFAVGMLLRRLEWGPRALRAPADLALATAPAYPIRGAQLGYRQKSDTYDAWDLSRFVQYVRDLTIFGNNSVELIPALSPAAAHNPEPDPLMPMGTWDMTLAVCAALDAYDMEVWLWLPLEDGAAEDPQRREASLREREGLFAACRRINHVFVPGGDPGNTPPHLLMPYLQELALVLRRHHPAAKLWVSPQGFEPEERVYFYRYLREQAPEWLEGVVYGPGCSDTLAHTREMIPARYPIRRYPDITHAVRCQYPFPSWDAAWAETYQRQPIQPRPTQYAHICNLLAPYAAGAVGYSDGVGDDVNKFVWNALLWDPQADLRRVLEDYGRCFVGPDFADGVAEGLLMLERNWTGPALTNPQVAQTLAHWQEMEKRAGPYALGAWRFQQGLIRAYGDAFVHERLRQETALLERAYEELARAPAAGPDAALDAAERLVAQADPLTAAPALRARAHELGDMLFASIGMQLSMKRHGANDLNRGAQLDNNDRPLTDCAWLRLRIPEIRALPDRAAKLAAIRDLLTWTDPGPGGFYDDLGNSANALSPHVVSETTWEQDPGFLLGVQDAHGGPAFPQVVRLSWTTQAQTTDRPLRLRYSGLDPQAAYLLRAAYTGRGMAMLQLYLDNEKIGEPLECSARDPRVREFDVPRSATADGALEVVWENIRGWDVHMAEAWLVRKD